MKKILISGLINVETTLAVDGFPINYSPVRYPFFGIRSTVSGVGFNIAKALASLGDEVVLVSMIGNDIHSYQVNQALSKAGVESCYVVQMLTDTPQSVILYSPDGKRQINVDLKDIQNQHYSNDKFTAALDQVDLAVLCNINFSRDYLARVKSLAIPIATDVHSISSLEDGYNHDFMAAANILFCSDESLPCSPEEWAEKLFARYPVNILVIGLGAKGAYLALRRDNIRQRFAPVFTRPVVNTIGAGDALFSGFLHYFMQTDNAILALRKAMVFASYKSGCSGAGDGFLSTEARENLCEQLGID